MAEIENYHYSTNSAMLQ